MMGESLERSGHAVLDLPSRDFKAMKIARLLGIDRTGPRKRLLEIGCGSGGISRWFGSEGTMGWDVEAVDVEDVRLVCDGYAFRTVKGTALPFDDASFDVVLTNHVIEHVGGDRAQAHHLSELRRVMKPDGIGYLAVPNRWMLVEPHYRLMFLSWWPHRWRTPYLRLWRRGEFYDCEPLEMRQLERMLLAAGLIGENLCVEGWRATFDIEHPGHLGTRLLSRMPDALLRMLNPINPTLIYRIERMDGQVDGH